MLRQMDRVMAGVVVVLGLVLLGMIALSVYNVVSRYVFNVSVLWADEIAIFAMIAISWIGGVVCAWRGLDIRMSIVVDQLPRVIRQPLAVVQHLAIAGLCGWVTWLSWGYVARLLRVGMVSNSAQIPLWVVHSAMTLSLGLIALIAAVRLIDVLTGGNGRFSPADRAAGGER